MIYSKCSKNEIRCCAFQVGFTAILKCLQQRGPGCFRSLRVQSSQTSFWLSSLRTRNLVDETIAPFAGAFNSYHLTTRSCPSQENTPHLSRKKGFITMNIVRHCSVTHNSNIGYSSRYESSTHDQHMTLP
ncbi:hypothetical protein NP493_85g05021 [Ridgeia piscesae]|uniref:Uncharacterized protein n=1 Tax=Ridgeia piscesae TaxID=27915 RepID=A0AAD9UIA8_RIDPI|nr:hypothetical protein NP493_85g05021 [Ridgeia piscesae]